MKKLLLFATILISTLFTFSTMYQPGPKDDYTELWKQVHKHAKEDRPKSALEIVDKIYATAKEAGNRPQVIKALIHQMKFSSYTDEESVKSDITRLNKELQESKDAVEQSLLHHMLGRTYWGYYNNNRWRIYNRTKGGEKEDDIATWTLEKITENASKHYKASIEAKKELQNTASKEFQAILDTEENIDLRPTLYDILAWEALSFFKDSSIELPRPAETFELDKAEYFSDAQAFIDSPLSTTDSTSLHFEALKIYQALLSFHSQSPINVRMDVDLSRLAFVHGNSIHPDKDALYEQTLENLRKVNDPSSARASHDLAELYFKQGKKYDPEKTPQYRWDIQKAHEICEQVFKQYPKSRGADECRELVADIETPSLSVVFEEISLPNEPSKALISYKNLDEVKLRIYKTTPETYQKLQEKASKSKQPNNQYIAKKLGEATPLHTISLDKFKEISGHDFQEHSAEVMIPALPIGHYIILANTDEEFNNDLWGNFSHKLMQVSRISYLKRSTTENENFLVLDRLSGKPLSNIEVNIFEQYYDRGYHRKKLSTQKTDKEGTVSINRSKNDGRRIILQFINGEDELWTGQSYISYYFNDTEKEDEKVHLFTDRAIYRPGQTVYFKGIALLKKGKTTSILTNESYSITLNDPNYQEVAELEVTTNEYGSFSGSFTIPQGRVNGQYHLESDYGKHYFRVEEYKRPTFETTFKPIEGSLKLNDSVKVTGLAKAFSGANIDGAKVSYRVVRRTSFPFRGWWYWGPPSPEVTITTGETTTDEKGEFEVNFPALPDESAMVNDKPLFIYTVHADVTDLNGETRTGSKSVSISTAPFLIKFDLPQELDKNGKKTFSLSTTNAEGQDIPAKGGIKITRLQSPEKAFEKRLWEAPDTVLVSKDDWSKNFPFAPIANEQNITQWADAESIAKQSFNTQKSKEQTLDFSEQETGVYRIDVSAIDDKGQEQSQAFYVTVFDKDAKKLPYPQLFSLKPIKSKGEPGEKAEFLVASSEKIDLLIEVEEDGKIVSAKRESLNKRQKLYSFPIEEKHRGNFVVHFSTIFHNREYIQSQTIKVPYSNKKLDVAFETFRDKLLPGQAEEWRIKIKGPKGEAVVAEMLASMYDASLDEFASQHWDFTLWPTYRAKLRWNSGRIEETERLYFQLYHEDFRAGGINYPNLFWFGYNPGNSYQYRSRSYYGNAKRKARYDAPERSWGFDEDEAMAEETAGAPAPASMNGASSDVTLEKKLKSFSFSTEQADEDSEPEANESSTPALRSNFNETAFFYPNLKTDAEGNVIIAFTIPESLTKWKFMGLAHTKDLKSGYIEQECVTQKDLMITANPPRFFRENDQIVFTAKVINLSEKAIKGTANLELINAITGKSISGMKEFKAQKVKVEPGQSAGVSWSFDIPENVPAIACRVTAKAGNHTDGEERTVPVLTNRMLVTESMPLAMSGKGEKTFVLDKLKENKSTTLRHESLTLEYTANPAWYAVQALPYLMEYPYECSEQTFSRLYANSIAHHIVSSKPKIQQTFEQWKQLSPEAFLSNLEKNQELKSLLLQETPWVLQAKNENERKKRVALLFDLNRMASEKATSIQKLKDNQDGSGGWPWFKGGPDSRYITQHIICGFGKLKKLDAIKGDREIEQMIRKGVSYLDEKLAEDYRWLIKHKADLDKKQVGYTQIHWLYMRSFFPEISISKNTKEAFNYYLGQTEKYWVDQSDYMRGMSVVALHRYDKQETVNKILQSIKENAIHNEEMGMYWKTANGYFWYQAPIETQALLIEAFEETKQDRKDIEAMKLWLLKNKQTNDWKTTKATTEACYALLMRGTDWLETTSYPEITVGKWQVKVNDTEPTNKPKPFVKEVKAEPGTGYFKTSWSPSQISNDMATVKVKTEQESASWGAVYWQYFEQLDKITPAETPLKLEKKLFKEVKTASGLELEPIAEGTPLETGDRIIVRIILKVDREMEYVHMKDMRASALEPENVLSSYKWQDGLGYYESTKDASTNFFFDRLPKGTFVFEYPLRVTHEGNFSNGVTSIQCMYAPEFASHSEGIRIEVR